MTLVRIINAEHTMFDGSSKTFENLYFHSYKQIAYVICSFRDI